MKNKKRVILVIVTVLSVIALLGGLSYAIWYYNNTGGNQELIVGDIWMNYNESTSKTISLSDANPSDTYDPNVYFEFTITGNNTYTKKDIWYDISLSYGEKPDDATRTVRIKDEFLRFRFVEVDSEENETVILNNQSFQDLTNKRIFIDTISSTDGEIERTYRLYMWITSDINICIGAEGPDCDYYTSTTDETLDWNKVFASIKVNVTGDFNEKNLSADMCFNASKVIDTYDYNNSDEAVSVCATYLEGQGFWINGSYEDYCRGTNSNNSLENDLNEYFKHYQKDFENTDIIYFVNNNIITNVTYGAYITGYNIKCGTDVVIPEKINGYNVIGVGGEYASWVGAHNYSGTDYTFSYPMFGELERAVQETNYWYHTATSAEIFHQSPFANMNLNSVTIPNTVKFIGEAAFANASLTEIEIPDSVEIIGPFAFLGNKIRDLVIPNSVKAIGSAAFSSNDLSTVVIGNGIEYIRDKYVFEIGAPDYWSGLDLGTNYCVSGGTNEDLTSITIDKTCEEIKNIKTLPSSNASAYPWLGYNSYTGITIYGSNNEVCDSF